MAGGGTYNINYVSGDTFNSNWEPTGDTRVVKENMSKEAALSPYFEVIDGVLYRKKLEKGYINYREVLDKDRRVGAIATFHQKRQGRLHHALDETYRYVAENYWWQGMYFQIREYVQNCRECRCHQDGAEAASSLLVSKTLASHSGDVLAKLKGQWEEGLFCDVTLRMDGRSFSAHRAVLAAVSEYFQELFTEMARSPTSDSYIDLTGFSEESFLSLLEFSYTSVLSLKFENLIEVSTMARHFRMWSVVEACKAIQREQVSGLTAEPCAGGCLSESPCPQPLQCAGESDTAVRKDNLYRHRKWTWGDAETDQVHDSPDKNFKVSQEPCGMPCKSAQSTDVLLRDTSMDANSFQRSPSRRLKLMDFKSPSNKGKTPPRRPPSRQLPVRVLRSSPVGETSGGPSMAQPSHSRSTKYKQRLCFQQVVQEGTPLKQEPMEEEVHSPRTLEKYQLLSMLGLQRKCLLPGPQELTGWRQKKRLRKLKVDSYSLTARRKPRMSAVEVLGSTSGFAAGGPSVSQGGDMAGFLHRVIKTEPPEAVSLEDARLGSADRPSVASSRNTRSAAVLKQTELRRSIRISGPPSLTLPHLQTRRTAQRTTSLGIKPEPITLPIQPPAAAVRSRCSARSNHQREPFFSLKAKSCTGPKCSLDELACRITKKGRDNGSRRGLSRAEANQNSVLSCRTKAVKPRTSKQPASPHKPVRRPDGAGKPVGPRGSSSAPLQHPPRLLRAVKEEAADPFPICAGPMPELGKRQSKPSVKLLDPGFLFTFCRPIGAIKKEEDERVDICVTRSITHSVRSDRQERRLRSATDIAGRTRSAIREACGLRHRELSLRQAEPALRSVHRPACRQRAALNGFRRTTLFTASKAKRNSECPEEAVQLPPLQSRPSVLLETIRQARLRQLRQVRARGPVTSHTCFQCKVTYRNCDVLIMHRIRHIEGKHWPCPLCGKMFFRQRNVQSHIRTHDHRLYKCHRCLSAS